jgi:mannosyltransferase
MITASPSSLDTADQPITRPGAQAPSSGRSPRRLPGWALIASPAAITLVVTLWGAGGPSYCGDEMDTVSAVSRTVPQLFRLLGHIDAVHGFYYLLLWPVARLAGTGQLATRIPSAVSMAAAAAGVTAIGRRLSSPRAGLCAGLMFAALPMVTSQGHDARPYAAVTAAAVLASYLLLRAAHDPRPAVLAAYGLALVLTGYLQLFGLLLVPAHAVTLASLKRRRALQAGDRAAAPAVTVARRWLTTVAAAGLAVTPVAFIGWEQRGSIAWIPRPGWRDMWDVVSTLTAPSAAAAAIVLLIAVGCIWGGAPAVLPGRGTLAAAGGADRSLTWLAAPWLVLPPLILVAASEIKPVYFSRYITFCLPAVALLAGAGLAALRLPVRAGALALVVALVMPTQLAYRAPGGGMEAVAQFLAAHEQPGDAIVYPASSIPPWDLAYPEGFSGLRDLSLSKTAAEAGRLNADTVPVPVLLQREQGVDRIWMLPGSGSPARFLAPGFGLAHQWKIGGQVVQLYTRPG